MTRLTLLPILVLLLHPAAGNASEDPLTMSSGAELFTRLCASCHGAQATGNGPLAASLRHDLVTVPIDVGRAQRAANLDLAAAEHRSAAGLVLAEDRQPVRCPSNPNATRS